MPELRPLKNIMKRIVFFLFLLVTLSLSFVHQGIAQTQTIAVVVNDEAITQASIDDRVKLIMVSSGLPDKPEVVSNVYSQVVKGLIDETIRLQEASRLGLEVTQEEIDKGFAQLAASNSMELAQFKSVLARTAININTLYDQIRAQVAWGKVVQTAVRPRIQVRDTEIDAARARVQAQVGSEEYLLAEIFLSVDDETEKQEVRALANKLVLELKKGAPFPRVAQQFSKSASASNGGDMGWVRADQLAPEIIANLKDMEKGSLSAPIETLSGYYIMLLRDQREITKLSVPSAAQLRQDIGQERLNRAQAQYFMELKSAAFVDERI